LDRTNFPAARAVVRIFGFLFAVATCPDALRTAEYLDNVRLVAEPQRTVFNTGTSLSYTNIMMCDITRLVWWRPASMDANVPRDGSPKIYNRGVHLQCDELFFVYFLFLLAS
jgi:hypothetical protein